MEVFKLEHSKPAYIADFVLYGLSIISLSWFLMFAKPQAPNLDIILLIFCGLVFWTFIEYGLHRFVLHGIEPFTQWHATHHKRPTALICAPTILSAMLILVLVFVPSLWLMNVWRACALTLGVLIGYFAYALTHHAIHHWHINNAWLKQRKTSHFLHHQLHHQADELIAKQSKKYKKDCCYGVTSGVLDKVFNTQY